MEHGHKRSWTYTPPTDRTNTCAEAFMGYARKRAKRSQQCKKFPVKKIYHVSISTNTIMIFEKTESTGAKWEVNRTV